MFARACVCVAVACDCAYGLLRLTVRCGYFARASYVVAGALSVVSSFLVRARVAYARASPLLCECALLCDCLLVSVVSKSAQFDLGHLSL